MKSLESKLEEEFVNLGVPHSQKTCTLNFLKIIKEHDPPTYQHCLRVGLIGSKVADFLKLDQKPLLYAGLLHDLGKVGVDKKVLEKTKGFNEEDYEKMSAHPSYAYLLLKNMFGFSAEIILRHHTYGQKSYPEKIPEPTIQFSEETKKLIEKYSELLALVDFYDALTTRETDFFGTTPKSWRKQKKLLIKNNPDQKSLIKKLYKEKIF